MSSTSVVLFLLSVLQLQRSLAGDHWNYDYPDHWTGICNTHGGKHRQSPIDIKSFVPFVTSPFRFKNYGLINTTQVNNGHSYNIALHPDYLQDIEDEKYSEELRPEISGGGLPGTYILDSIHFHWGRDSRKGSEHLFRGCAFEGEMHYVHYKKEYGSLQEALKHPHDGLAVLGVWLDSSHAKNHKSHFNIQAVASKADYNFMPGSLPLSGMCKYTEEEHDVSSHHWFYNIRPHGNDKKMIRVPVHLRQMLPFDTERFFRYEGSLTTPPCTENVVWTVFAQKVLVPQDFLSGLRLLTVPDHPTHSLSDNFRPPQALSGRSVFYSGDSIEIPILCIQDSDFQDKCTTFPEVKISSYFESEDELEEGATNCPVEPLPSPINLYLIEAEPLYSPALTWKRIGNCKAVDVVNDGYVVKVLYPEASPEWELTGGNITTGYYLAGMLLRWNSEHRLGGLIFPLEIQLVHYNSRYKNVMEALRKRDGLVVVSKFFQEPVSLSTALDEFQEYPEGYNNHLTGIIYAVEHTARKPLGRMRMRSPDVNLLMGDTSSFYEYLGSFESWGNAPCNTQAAWMIIRQTGHISHSQLRSLRKMRSSEGFSITSNNRQLAPTNNRRIILRVNSHELRHEMEMLTRRGKESPLSSSGCFFRSSLFSAPSFLLIFLFLFIFLLAW